MIFELDDAKNISNQLKHEISFKEAQYAFLDRKRIIRKDVKHSTEKENRYFCFGNTKKGIVTVRFTMRDGNIRIFSAGLWRQGRRIYEEENGLY